jgi:hypothetical protein
MAQDRISIEYPPGVIAGIDQMVGQGTRTSYLVELSGTSNCTASEALWALDQPPGTLLGPTTVSNASRRASEPQMRPGSTPSRSNKGRLCC